MRLDVSKGNYCVCIERGGGRIVAGLVQTECILMQTCARPISILQLLTGLLSEALKQPKYREGSPSLRAPTNLVNVASTWVSYSEVSQERSGWKA